MGKVSLHVNPDTRDEVQKTKYELGLSSADEVVRYLLREARA